MEKIKLIYARQSMSNTDEEEIVEYECDVHIYGHNDETTDLFFSLYDPASDEYKEEILTINGRIESLDALSEWLNGDTKFKVVD